MEKKRQVDLVWNKGYCYRKSSRRPDCMYLKCVDKILSGCVATAKISTSNALFTPICSDHNHPPHLDKQRKHEFLEELKNYAGNSLRPYREIYNEVAKKYEIPARSMSFNSVVIAMRTKRREQFPPVPRSLDVLAQQLDRDKFLAQNVQFYIAYLRMLDHQETIIFGSSNFVNSFPKGSTLFIDGSFNLCVNEPNITQILTIYGTYQQHTFPMLHLISNGLAHDLYKEVFRVLTLVCPNLEPTQISLGNDHTVQAALRCRFPNVRLNCCWFQYMLAVYHIASECTTLAEAQAAEAMLHFYKYLALPLLRADLIDDAITQLTDTNTDVDFTILHEYIEEQWLCKFGDNLSVFGEETQLNYVFDLLYNRNLSTWSTIKEFHLWRFLTFLHDKNIKAQRERQRLVDGFPIRERQANYYQNFAQHVTNGWQLLDERRLTAGAFLDDVAKFIQKLM